jgi:transcriptional regulator with XRE-family HTH domain
MLKRLAGKVAYMSTFAERLALALTAKGCSRTDLARALRSSKGTMGISATAVSLLLSGDSKSMTAENAARAAKLLGVDLYWLCTGEGSMLSAAPPAGLLTDELLRALAVADPARQRQAENAARNVLELEPLPRVGNTALAA